jgi:hypothetical protein
MVATRSSVRVGLYLVKIRKYNVDSQGIRAKLLSQLNALFKLAISIAKGKIKRLTDDEGKVYTVSPQQRMKWARLAEKLLVYLGEDDRYYRQWLGLAFLLMHGEVEKTLEGLSFEDFLTLTKQQWLLDYHGAVSPEYFNSHKIDFLNIVLTDFLLNLV